MQQANTFFWVLVCMRKIWQKLNNMNYMQKYFSFKRSIYYLHEILSVILNEVKNPGKLINGIISGYS
jgi:hypothetical protein